MLQPLEADPDKGLQACPLQRDSLQTATSHEVYLTEAVPQTPPPPPSHRLLCHTLPCFDRAVFKLSHISPMTAVLKLHKLSSTLDFPSGAPCQAAFPQAGGQDSHSAPAALESPSVTLRPTEEEEETKAENAKGVEQVAVQRKQQNGLQNGQDGAASQKVSTCQRLNLLLLCHQAHSLCLLLKTCKRGLPCGLDSQEISRQQYCLAMS